MIDVHLRQRWSSEIIDYFWIIATFTQCLKSIHHWYRTSVVQLMVRPCRWQHGVRVHEFPEGVGSSSVMRLRARSSTSKKPLPAMVLPAGTTVHSDTCMELEMLLWIPGMNNLQTSCMKCQPRKQYQLRNSLVSKFDNFTHNYDLSRWIRMLPSSFVWMGWGLNAIQHSGRQSTSPSTHK